jgi:hypothetical protein
MFSFSHPFCRILLGVVEMERRSVTRHRSIRLQGKNQPRRQSQPQIQRQRTPPPLSPATSLSSPSVLPLQQLQQQSSVPPLPELPQNRLFAALFFAHVRREAHISRRFPAVFRPRGRHFLSVGHGKYRLPLFSPFPSFLSLTAFLATRNWKLGTIDYRLLTIDFP